MSEVVSKIKRTALWIGLDITFIKPVQFKNIDISAFLLLFITIILLLDKLDKKK